jgi:hypothetical protein
MMVILAKTWRPLHEMTTEEVVEGFTGWGREEEEEWKARSMVGVRQAQGFRNAYRSELRRRLR